MPRRSSLKTLTTVFILILVAGAVLVTSFVLYARLSARMEADVVLQLDALANDVASAISNGIDDRINDVVFASLLPALRREDLRPERRPILENLKRHSSDYAWVGMAGLDGTVEEGTGGLLIGASVKGRDWFEDGRKGLFIGDLHEAILLGKLLPPPADGGVLRLLDIAAPVQGVDGVPRSVLCAHIDWTFASTLIKSYLARRGLSNKADVMIINRDKTVLHGPYELKGRKLPDELLYRPGVKKWEDRLHYLTVAVPVLGGTNFSGLGWQIVARQEYSYAFGELQRETWSIAGISLMSFFFFAWLGLRAVRWCLDPLQKIVDATVLSDGQSVQQVYFPESGRYQEVARLADSLNRLFKRIGKAEEDREALLESLEKRVQDRTAELSSAQALLVDAVECIRDAFCLFDSDERVIMCNSHYRMLAPNARAGVGFSELLQDALGERFFPEDPEESLEDFRKRRLAYRANPVGAFPARIDDRHVQIINRRTSAGGMVSVIRDVTEDYEREQALLGAKVAADKANAAKSEFLSRMSHELRTPLNAVLGYGQVMQLNKKEPLQPKQVEAVNHIMTAGEHLLHLINEVLDLARIEAGRVDLMMDDVDLHGTAMECVSMVTELAKSTGVEIRPTEKMPDIAVRADALRLRQVLINLLSNAIKYNRPGGEIRLEWVIDSGFCRISVIDNGPGIPSGKEDELFVPFSRLGAERSSTQGTGIGLSISRHLMEAMGGGIEYAPTPGGGATFRLNLMLAEKSSRMGNGQPLLKEELDDLEAARGCVIYIEDNDANIALMQAVFDLIPRVTLMTYRTAEAGLEAVLTIRPCLVLMDINLPGMNGYEALKKLRSEVETCNIPVIAVSAASTQSDMQRGEGAGFNAYLSKPFNVRETLRTIEAHMAVTMEDSVDEIA